MGYSRMICAGNRVMVLFEGYSQEELVPILKVLNELVMDSGNVPEHLIPPEMKPKSGETAMAEALKQAGAALGRQEKVAEKRRQTLSANIQPPKFMQNAMKNEETQSETKAAEQRDKQAVSGTMAAADPTVSKNTMEKQQPQTKPEPKTQPAAPVIKDEAKSSCASAMEGQSATAQTKPENTANQQPQAEGRKEAPSSSAPARMETTPAQPASNPVVPAPQPEAKTAAPDVTQMSKADLRNFFIATDRMVLQKILQTRGEFPNRGIFLGKASEQQMREYAKLVISA